jgi:hypothetical protein
MPHEIVLLCHRLNQVSGDGLALNATKKLRHALIARRACKDFFNHSGVYRWPKIRRVGLVLQHLQDMCKPLR